ncbi:MAG: SusC/RagA family TonB-linked outer membrane protein [Bacteroidales bacterium]
MKNFSNLKCRLRDCISSQTLLKMKLTFFLLLVAFLQVNAKGYSQMITLKQQNAQLEDVFVEIMKQTNSHFIYSPQMLKDTKPVDIDITSVSLEEALELCFDGQPITYVIENNTVIVKMKELPPPPIKGTVVDENGKPISFVNVVVKGTTTGTYTDDFGVFNISVKKGDILQFSFIGYHTVEVTVGDNPINVVMKASANILDEVQIIGYGVTTKRNNTGSISSVKSKQLEVRPVTNVMQALQGQVSGVSITNFSPGIGSPVSVLIRGVNSITSGTNPLIIIDGVVINSNPGDLISAASTAYSGSGANTYQQGNNVLNSINPNDIESIDILKDADATAIYGSRGTNGVILITTKRASLGKTIVSITASTGMQSPTGLTERLNTEEYLKLRRDAFATGNMTSTSVINPITPTTQNAPDLMLWSQTAYTDYTKLEVGNAAPTYSADATISGGTKSINFLATGSYYKMYDSYMFKPYQQRLTGRMQINHTSVNERFNIKLSSIFGLENQKFSQTNMSNVNAQAMVNAPNFEMYNADGTLNFATNKGYTAGQYYNPMPMKFVDNFSTTKNLMLNGEISYEFLKGLVAKVQVNYGMQSNKYRSLFPSTALSVQTDLYNSTPSAQHTTNTFTSLNIEPQITYTKQILKGTLSALAGVTFLDKTQERTGITIKNPGSDDLLYSWSSGNPTSAASNKYYTRFSSVFGRANFNWDRKYIANITFRRDGSSRFGTNNRFANFASAGFAWIFTEEPFLKNILPILNYGKLRGSYGTTGNDNISDYIYLSLLQAPSSTLRGMYQGSNGLDPVNYANENVQWETTTKSDVGMELGFFKSRIMLNATWYRSVSSNLLTALPLPGQSGFSSYTGNFEGIVQNTGVEIELNTQNLSPKSDVRWSTKFNITQNKNILKEFPNLVKSSYATTMQIGRALPSSYSLNKLLEMPVNFNGIDPATGLPLFKDLNGDNNITSSDMSVNAAWIGSSQPTIWGGMNNSLGYKGFNMDVFIQFSDGIFTKWNYYNQSPVGSMFNPSKDVIDNYWMKPGDVKKYPRLYTNVTGTAAYINPLTQYYPYSTATLYKGYYIRLKNIQLSYSLPASLLSKTGVEQLMIYINGENLAVYTPEKLYKDPEIYWSRNSSVLRVFTLGIKASF